MSVSFSSSGTKSRPLPTCTGTAFPSGLAATIFHDPRLLTVADLEHSETEERWLSIGMASNGSILCIVYVWTETEPVMTKIRLISARRATPAEIIHYQERL